MKNAFLAALLALALLGGGCLNSSIEGTWSSTNPDQQYKITFSDGLMSGDDLPAPASYRLVNEASPRQIYIGFKNETGNVIETPFAIYKVEGNKLILKFATEYVQTIGIVPTGSRYEFPKDFTGEIEVLERAK